MNGYFTDIIVFNLPFPIGKNYYIIINLHTHTLTD